MQTVRGNLIYTGFATVIFLGIQWFDGTREWELMAFSGLMFFVFTFFMLRLIQRVLAVVMKNRGPRNTRGRGGRNEEERGPAVLPPTTERPEHVRRRRERRRRR